jgi:hypothetical protein
MNEKDETETERVNSLSEEDKQCLRQKKDDINKSISDMNEMREDLHKSIFDGERNEEIDYSRIGRHFYHLDENISNYETPAKKVFSGLGIQDIYAHCLFKLKRHSRKVLDRFLCILEKSNKTNLKAEYIEFFQKLQGTIHSLKKLIEKIISKENLIWANNIDITEVRKILTPLGFKEEKILLKEESLNYVDDGKYTSFIFPITYDFEVHELEDETLPDVKLTEEIKQILKKNYLAPRFGEKEKDDFAKDYLDPVFLEFDEYKIRKNHKIKFQLKLQIEDEDSHVLEEDNNTWDIKGKIIMEKLHQLGTNSNMDEIITREFRNESYNEITDITNPVNQMFNELYNLLHIESEYFTRWNRRKKFITFESVKLFANRIKEYEILVIEMSAKLAVLFKRILVQEAQFMRKKHEAINNIVNHYKKVIKLLA